MIKTRKLVLMMSIKK